MDENFSDNQVKSKDYGGLSLGFQKPSWLEVIWAYRKTHSSFR
jgi:hypothetical protein